jgi:hypothetical protein
MLYHWPKLIFSNDVPVSRFQIAARVMSVYLVDMVSRAVDFHLAYIKSHQANIFGGTDNYEAYQAQDDQAEDQEDGHDNHSAHTSKVNKRVFLSSSVHGSPRMLRDQSVKALSLVGYVGLPTLFITATCNATWPEILEMLLPGQSAFDRPDIVCRVFHDKLHKLLEEIKKGRYFGAEHPVDYLMYVIEYQHRGMPHAHIVVKLRGAPTSLDGHETCARWVDKHISAVMPTVNERDLYYRSVKKHMVHGCAVAVNGCKSTPQSTCKRGFDSTKPRPSTVFDERNFPQYKRMKDGDCKVVPHNGKMLCDWQGHINVEFAGGARSVLYLYKYLYKGMKKVKVHVEGQDRNLDEVDVFVKGRFLCAMDACRRMFRFQTYRKTIHDSIPSL